MTMCCVLAYSKWSTSPTLSVQELTGIRGPVSAGQSARGEAGAFQVKICLWIKKQESFLRNLCIRVWCVLSGLSGHLRGNVALQLHILQVHLT